MPGSDGFRKSKPLVSSGLAHPLLTVVNEIAYLF